MVFGAIFLCFGLSTIFTWYKNKQLKLKSRIVDVVDFIPNCTAHFLSNVLGHEWRGWLFDLFLDNPISFKPPLSMLKC